MKKDYLEKSWEDLQNHYFNLLIILIFLLGLTFLLNYYFIILTPVVIIKIFFQKKQMKNFIKKWWTLSINDYRIKESLFFLVGHYDMKPYILKINNNLVPTEINKKPKTYF